MIEWRMYRDAPYREILDFQRELFTSMVEHRRMKKPVEGEYALIVEHRPVYTIGRHGRRDNIIDSKSIHSKGVDVVEIERGGDVTFHGPGQLVVYPIIDIAKRGLGVKGYVHLLEEAVIRVIAEYGIKGERVEGATGVWIDAGKPHERKICAIGIKCSRFVTMHGLALNVSTDLGWFSAINPCGFVDKGVTSMAVETGMDIEWGDVAERMKKHLSELLAIEI